MFGNGLSGIVINILRAICLIAFGASSFIGTLVYFILSAVILIICALAQFFLARNKFVNYYVNLASKENKVTERKISGVGEDDMSLGTHGNGDLNKSSSTVSKMELKYSAPSEITQPITKPKVSPLKTFFIMLVNSFKQAWTFLLALFWVFLITFIVFPGTTSDTKIMFMKEVPNRSAW